MNMVALIPARAGSKRVPGKNTRLLYGKPLLVWSIEAALASGVFDAVMVSTEDAATAVIAMDCGVKVHLREAAHAADDSPDIHWVRAALRYAEHPNAFAILRPTSPFRTAATIRRAYRQFSHDEAHSLRAVQPVSEHPGKMWQCYGAGYPIVPLIGAEWPSQGPGLLGLRTRDETPWHSQPTQTLPTVYIQNASLEMAWSYVIPAFGTISGRKVAPFFTEGDEGFDINTEDDWTRAVAIAHAHHSTV